MRASASRACSVDRVADQRVEDDDPGGTASRSGWWGICRQAERPTSEAAIDGASDVPSEITLVIAQNGIGEGSECSRVRECGRWLPKSGTKRAAVDF